ncbi:MAG: hypothetical protein IPJ08_12570 [Burkholderiales bacterium]|nr:hypothetical protein [Burkholderiales bacterium]
MKNTKRLPLVTGLLATASLLAAAEPQATLVARRRPRPPPRPRLARRW